MLTILGILLVLGTSYTVYRLLAKHNVTIRRLTKKELAKPGKPEKLDAKAIYIAQVPEEAAFVKAFGPDYIQPKVVDLESLEKDLHTLNSEELQWLEEQAGSDENIRRLLDKHKEKP